jgi:hypothetical protein
MNTSAAAMHRPRRLVRAGWTVALLGGVLLGVWSLIGSEARGSDVLIVIEDASPNPTGLFPGTVCYEVTRVSDGMAVSQGCLAMAAAIAAPAGLDRGLIYALEVTVHDARCTVLDDPRTGSGLVPFRVRILCQPLSASETDAADSVAPGGRTPTFVPASASPIALPITTGP